jgi:nucleoside triphosphate pyrophosphatase
LKANLRQEGGSTDPPSFAPTHFLLASSSPRRHELLSQLGFGFDIIPSSVDEESFTGGRPEALARRIARAKAQDVAAQYPDAIVLAADTIVVLGGDVLGKPLDADEARRMLNRLRGRRHRVITAVCVIAPGRRLRIEHTVTRVNMRPYAAEEVDAFIASGSPFDKAGGYAVQDANFAPVASYQGCYCNILGLPLWTALGLLAEADVPRSGSDMPIACDGCVTKPQDALPPQ